MSLKIKTADSTDQFRELHTLRALSEHANGRTSSGYIVQLIDDFLHEGPNGCHQCLVFELLGPTLDVIIEKFYGVVELIDTRTIFMISGQLLHAVTFVHGGGYAHGGKVDSDPLAESCRCSKLILCRP